MHTCQKGFFKENYKKTFIPPLFSLFLILQNPADITGKYIQEYQQRKAMYDTFWPKERKKPRVR